ncbi:hydroxymethylpyrimidine pyrophosphatase-like HAD family hydrolase [Rubricella aquisinus]|uniref:Hydroxymethylpyrimidine pyrophosphatase-like HAD family hydrolase n=1 Tax=Rubricella aquisinus TaxID=2028108 RepID=A0A840X472_9RHOB|nr:HAD family hydrolase [Rubricella aquisinus]MBB5516606.1 hydroxymethylpyrimidine pyrophosphatase-like HAD family hydrolase [Rubricella aquisinus]
MTDMTPNAAERVAAWHFVLATDLDGTFLGGSAADRRALYDWIEAQRSSVGLIFVTGRDPEFILKSCAEGVLPWPDFVVGDVGTTIGAVKPAGDTRKLHILHDLEAEIAALWADGTQTVQRVLKDAPGLTPQPTEFRYRMSYHYDPATFDPEAIRTIEALGYDVLMSDNMYFDVLPKGVSKGPSLLRLMDHLGIAKQRVLVAGDTLNDLSMFETGLKGAVVGGAEAPLLERTEQIPTARHCTAIGAAGISEAIRTMNLHPTPPGATE